MLGCSSSGSRPAPSTGGVRAGRERIGQEHRQRDEERGEAEQHGGRVRGDLAHPPAGQEQDQARPHRQQEHPQQQRALLRGPRGGRLVERRRRRRGVTGDDVEREVRAQERDLEDRERERHQPGQRVHGPAAGIDPLAAPRDRRRTATRRCRTERTSSPRISSARPSSAISVVLSDSRARSVGGRSRPGTWRGTSSSANPARR